MTRSIRAIIAPILLFSSIISINNACSANSPADVPIEAFFKNVQFTDMSMSPDGKHLAVKYRKGTSDIVSIMDINLTTVKSTINFGEYRRITRIMWPRNDRFILGQQRYVGYLDNRSSPEILVAYDLDGKNGRQLTRPVRSYYSVISMMPSDPEKILVTKTHAVDYWDDGQTKLFTIDVDSGKEDYIAGEPLGAQIILADTNGVPRIATAYDEDNNDEFGQGLVKIFLKQTPSASWRKVDLDIYDRGTMIRLLGFNADSTVAYFSSDKEFGGESIYSIELATLETKLIHREDRLDLFGLAPLYNGALEIVSYATGHYDVVFLSEDSEFKEVVTQIYAAFEGDSTSLKTVGRSFTEDGNATLIHVSTDKDPGQFYLFNRGLDGSTPSIKYLASTQTGINPELMADKIPFSFNARDGVELNGYYMLPITGQAPFPMVQIVHGGPHGIRDYWEWNNEAQFLASRGYAVVMVNFRGSGGYGRDFLQSGFGHWGDKMIDDKTDATYWMIEQGFADKERLCIYGGSYGGYGTLQSLVREPDLYQCGIGYVGVYDLLEMKKSGDIPKTESGRKYLDTVLGKDKEQLKAFSPAYNVEKIKADLFIAHGSKDVRVPMSQYKSLSKNLKRINKPYISMVREEGHGYSNEQNRFDFYRQMETFLAQHLKPEESAQPNLQSQNAEPLQLQGESSE